MSSAPRKGTHCRTVPEEDTKTRDKKPGQRVEVRKDLVLGSAGHRLVLRAGGKPRVLFLVTPPTLVHHHGRMDHPGEAAGGSCPAALHHDWEVRRRPV